MILFEYLIQTEKNAVPMLRLYDTKVEPFHRVYREHRHTAFEIAVCRSGSGIYQTENRIHTMQKGDVFFFGSNDPHCITKIHQGEDMLLTTVQFEPRFIWAYGNCDFEYKYLNLFTKSSVLFEHKFAADTAAAKTIETILTEMKGEYLKKQPEYESMIRIALSRMMIFFIRKFGDSVQDNISVRNYNLANLNCAMDYIDRHFDTDISLDFLADQAHISRTYFCSVFKKLNGLTPWDYITIRRIDKAVVLLKTTDFTILQIAAMCGYNSTANFNRAFRKITGKTPGVYRKYK